MDLLVFPSPWAEGLGPDVAYALMTRIARKAVEPLGPLGDSKKLLPEKWMRDAW